MQHRTLTTIGLTLLLVTGMSGVGFAAPAASTNSQIQNVDSPSSSIVIGQENETQNETQNETETPQAENETEIAENETETPDEDDQQEQEAEGEQEDADGQIDLAQINATALDAIQAAQDRVQGKVIDVELGTLQGNAVYSLAFIQENRTVTGVLVDVSNQSVIRVTPNAATVSEQDLGVQQFNFSELRTAAEAIRFAQNATNGTVVEVELSEGALIYRVEFRTAAGGQSEVLVAAAEGPVLSVQSEPAPQQGNETGETAQEGNQTETGGQ